MHKATQKKDNKKVNSCIAADANWQPKDAFAWFAQHFKIEFYLITCYPG